jgi:hypothetical protein
VIEDKGESLIKSQLDFFLVKEQQVIDDILSKQFGYFLLHFNRFNCVDTSTCKIPHQFGYSRQLQFATDICGLANQLPIASESVDLLVMPHILGAIDNQGLLLEEAYRVLRNDGMFILTEFNGWRAKSHKLWQELNKKVPQSINKPIVKKSLKKRLFKPKGSLSQLMSLQSRIFQVEQFGFEVVKKISFPLIIPSKDIGFKQQQWYHKFTTDSSGLAASVCLGYVLLLKKSVSELTPIKPRWNGVKAVVDPLIKKAEPVQKKVKK